MDLWLKDGTLTGILPPSHTNVHGHGEIRRPSFSKNLFPSMYIIGADGNILYVGVGVESEDKEKKPSEQMQAYYDKLVDIIEKQLQKIGS